MNDQPKPLTSQGVQIGGKRDRLQGVGVLTQREPGDPLTATQRNTLNLAMIEAMSMKGPTPKWTPTPSHKRAIDALQISARYAAWSTAHRPTPTQD